MAGQFNAEEIFEMAEQIERNGAKYYNKAADGFEDEKTRKMLHDLAAQEVEHERTFKKLREELGSKQKVSTTFDPNGESALYLRAFADGHVFDTRVDPSAKLTGSETLADILEQAIGMEKDSIVFYLGMKEITPEKFGRDHIEGIIKEEMRHVSMLSKQLTQARKG